MVACRGLLSRSPLRYFTTMTKYTPFILVLVYCFLSSTLLFLALAVFNRPFFTCHISSQLYYACSWLVFCFTGAYWWPLLMLTKMNAGRCVPKDEHLLRICLREIKVRTGDKTVYQLYMVEDDHPHLVVLGSRTIVVSDTLLSLLTDQELTAILARELGHLRSMEGITSAALSVAMCITQCLKDLYQSIVLRIKYGNDVPTVEGKKNRRICFIICLIGGLLLCCHLLLAVTFTLVLISLLDPIFLFLWRWNISLTDYHHDAFAQRLGYGDLLIDALLKMLPYHNQLATWNRIRQLENWTGLR